MVIRYARPTAWLSYRPLDVLERLTAAKAAILTLTQIPYQRSWADQLQQLQLKREVAGTSRIEGAEFTERELDRALRESPAQLETRSQRQAAAAVTAYQWIAGLSLDVAVDVDLVRTIHRHLVTGCDDDHCPPGVTRTRDQNVVFGVPQHRGIEGGKECDAGLEALTKAVRTAFLEHDPLIQALALHYHFAAMHPFLDGNGRTARALEAFMLRRVGLRDTLFIAMSNYYYEEKAAYLQALSDSRAADHDLTPFLLFSLRGIERQCQSLFREIRSHLEKALFRNTVTDLFGRLKSPRKRVITGRHVQLLNLLLDDGALELDELIKRTRHLYTVKNPQKAIIRDLNYLIGLGTIEVAKTADNSDFLLTINMRWPTEITETEFFKRIRNLPKGKVHGFLSS